MGYKWVVPEPIFGYLGGIWWKSKYQKYERPQIVCTMTLGHDTKFEVFRPHWGNFGCIRKSFILLYLNSSPKIFKNCDNTTDKLIHLGQQQILDFQFYRFCDQTEHPHLWLVQCLGGPYSIKFPLSSDPTALSCLSAKK